LFCFPYAGGSALTYRDWAARLPAHVEVYPVQLPGRGDRVREKPISRMLPLAHAVARELLPLIDRPFALFGHSMGAILAFEIARLLRKHRAPQPLHLFASGHTAPQAAATAPQTYNLPDAELMEELRRLNGTPEELLGEPELMKVMLPLLRADFEADQAYAYAEEPPLNCPISVYGGLRDPETSREELEAWRRQTTSSCTVRMFPGDHFFINTDREMVLQTLSRELYQYQLVRHGVSNASSTARDS
jgi:medium-chain acyl-[acyl-carrier-protein] hydrolase